MHCLFYGLLVLKNMFKWLLLSLVISFTHLLILIYYKCLHLLELMIYRGELKDWIMIQVMGYRDSGKEENMYLYCNIYHVILLLVILLLNYLHSITLEMLLFWYLQC